MKQAENRAPIQPLFAREQKRQKQGKRSLVTGAATALWFVLQAAITAAPSLAQQPQGEAQNEFSYSELLQDIEAGKVNRIEIDPVRSVAEVHLKGQPDNASREVVLFAGENPELFEAARKNNVDYDVQPSADSSAIAGLLFHGMLAFVAIMILLMFLRRSGNASGQAMNFGKSRARFQMEAKTGVMFDDVALSLSQTLFTNLC